VVESDGQGIRERSFVRSIEICGALGRDPADVFRDALKRRVVRCADGPQHPARGQRRGDFASLRQGAAGLKMTGGTG
jgi:hypothetical protein